jgi:hypothetical protein
MKRPTRTYTAGNRLRADRPVPTKEQHTMNIKLVSDNTDLKCPGVGRDAGNDKSLCFYFSRKVSDDEMRYLHDVMQRAVAMASTACQRPDRKP